MTAKAFGMFGEQKTLAEVAVETEQPAPVVKRLFADYCEMAGATALSRANLEALRAALGGEARPRVTQSSQPSQRKLSASGGLDGRRAEPRRRTTVRS